MNPRHASAHTLCIAERRSRSSRVRGHDEAHADAVAGGGGWERHRVDEVGTMLQVVQRRQRVGRVGGARVLGGVVDQFAFHPQRRWFRLQSIEHLLSGSSSHCTPPHLVVL
jgi:hypothetical protein